MIHQAPRGNGNSPENRRRSKPHNGHQRQRHRKQSRIGNNAPRRPSVDTASVGTDGEVLELNASLTIDAPIPTPNLNPLELFSNRFSQAAAQILKEVLRDGVKLKTGKNCLIELPKIRHPNGKFLHTALDTTDQFAFFFDGVLFAIPNGSMSAPSWPPPKGREISGELRERAKRLPDQTRNELADEMDARLSTYFSSDPSLRGLYFGQLTDFAVRKAPILASLISKETVRRSVNLERSQMDELISASLDNSDHLSDSDAARAIRELSLKNDIELQQHQDQWDSFLARFKRFQYTVTHELGLHNRHNRSRTGEVRDFQISHDPLVIYHYLAQSFPVFEIKISDEQFVESFHQRVNYLRTQHS